MAYNTIVVLAYLVLASTAFGQRQAENWYFGEQAGLNFRTGLAVALTDGAMTTREGCITVSDTSGRLLFYSDGTDVWTRSHNAMPTGNRLLGNGSSTQSCIVVPWPGIATRYIIFTVDAVENNYANGLNYSVVTMSVNGGNGDVTQRNVVLQTNTAEKITAVRHANGEDAWVIAHGMDNNEFLVYRVTRTGVDPNPSRQRIGPTLRTGDIGYLRSNSQGTRLAMATTTPGTLTLFRFDRGTGIVSTPLTLRNVLTYGVEFSPSGRFLYSSAYNDAAIFQYDLSVADASIASTRIEIGRSGAASNGALQLAPNGRIYVAHEFALGISEIASPDLRGTASQFRDRIIDLVGKQSRLGLPNMFPAVFSKEVTYNVITSDGCAGDTISFSLQPPDSVNNVRWEFGDLSSGSANRATGNNVRHVYRTSGAYTIRVNYRNANGTELERMVTINIGAKPVISAGPDQTVCGGQSVQLRALGVALFSWSPGALLSDSNAVAPRATITKTTSFILTGRSPEGCEAKDTVTIFVNSGRISASADTSICEGTSAQLRASGATSYVWSPANTLNDPRSAQPIATPAASTTYRVIGTSGPCVDTTYVAVTVAPPPTITTTGDVSTCAGIDVVLTAMGAVRYEWRPAMGLSDSTSESIVVRPLVTTTYTVRGWSIEGCQAETTVTVTIGGIVTVQASADTTICNGTSVDLHCYNIGTVQWTDRSTGSVYTGATINVTPQTDTWYVIEVDAGGCKGGDSILVIVLESPPLTVSSDTTICDGDTVVLTAQGASTVAWTPSTGLESPNAPVTRAWPRATTTYTVTSNNAGCESTASVTVTVNPRVAIVLQSEQITATPGATVRTPILVTSNIVGLEPIILSVRAPRSLTLVNAVPQTGLFESSRINVADDQIVTYEIGDISTAPILCELEFDMYLASTTNRVITCSASPKGCGSEGSMSIVVDLGACAGPIRNVVFGTQKALALKVHPMPVVDYLSITWSSPAIGIHNLEVYDYLGNQIYTSTWTRESAYSPLTGTAIFPVQQLVPGIYAIRLLTKESHISTLWVK